MALITNIIHNNPLVLGDTERVQALIREKEFKLREFKCCSPMSYEEFKELLIAYATEMMILRSVTQPYIVDSNNGPIIKQLYLYFTNSSECKWNLNAGFVLGGKVGCGKSLLMMAYLKIADEYSRRRTTTVHTKLLAGLIKKNGIEFYEKRPMNFEELGREETEAKDYGNVVKPVIDLFAMRYEAGSRTYATTNFKYDSLEKFYGDFIRSRMEEMMTYVVVPGESRRLKNEVKTK
jgi:hypothetical protein